MNLSYQFEPFQENLELTPLVVLELSSFGPQMGAISRSTNLIILKLGEESLNGYKSLSNEFYSFLPSNCGGIAM